jgi:hypothetical protein
MRNGGCSDHTTETKNINSKFASRQAERLRMQFLGLNQFQESWIPTIKSGGYKKFELYDLDKDLAQKTDVAEQFPDVVNRLKKQLIDITASVMTDGPDWHLVQSDTSPPNLQPTRSSSAEPNRQYHFCFSMTRTLSMANRKRIAFIALGLLASFLCDAVGQDAKAVDLPEELPLWEKPPSDYVIRPAIQEQVRSANPRPESPTGMHRAFSSVTSPTYSIHRPQNQNGVGLVICPGGGFRDVWIDFEGHDLAKCVDFYATLLRAGFNAEIHVFSKGSHGFGLGDGRGKSTEIWPTSFVAWLRDSNIIDD